MESFIGRVGGSDQDRFFLFLSKNPMQFSNFVRTVFHPLVLVAALSALVAVNVSAAVPAGKFESSQKVQGTTLLLNGFGTRYRLVTRTYAVALYTQHKVTTPEDLLALPGPKRLNFVALHDVPGTDLGLAFVKGLVANSPVDLVQKNAASTTRMIDIFSARPKLLVGDSFAIEYIPGKGTTFYLDDQAQGAPIGGAEFFELVLKIWVGPSPVDFKLKDALLGV